MSQNKTLTDEFMEKVGEGDFLQRPYVVADFFISHMRERIEELDKINRAATGWSTHQVAYGEALSDLLEYLK